MDLVLSFHDLFDFASFEIFGISKEFDLTSVGSQPIRNVNTCGKQKFHNFIFFAEQNLTILTF